jgi:hypothetical protein
MATGKPKPKPRRISRKKPTRATPTDPPPVPAKGNGHALKTGAQADGKNLAGFEETRAEVQRAIDSAAWIQGTDLILLDVFTRELHAYKYTSDALARMGDTALLKKLSATKLQIRRARVLGELAGRMGFTAESRYRLGLTQARTERERVRVVPVRSEERAQKVAELLARSGALPPVLDAEVVHDDPEEKT